MSTSNIPKEPLRAAFDLATIGVVQHPAERAAQFLVYATCALSSGELETVNRYAEQAFEVLITLRDRSEEFDLSDRALELIRVALRQLNGSDYGVFSSSLLSSKGRRSAAECLTAALAVVVAAVQPVSATP